MCYNRSPQGLLLVALLMCSAFVVNLAAQQTTVTLRGTVFDSTTLLPIPGVAVLFDGSTFLHTTNSAGSFSLAGIERGDRGLVFLKNGYSARTFSITVDTVHTGELDVGLVLLALGPAPTAGIVGTVRDSMTRLPLFSADVLINGEMVAKTDLAGVFRIPSIELSWGSNLLAVRRVGYEPLNAELWTTTTNADLKVEVELMPLALRLPEVVVEGERTVFHFGRAREFVRRSRTGLGQYITRQDIERRQPLMITDAIERVPGVYVGPIATGSPIRFLRGGGCTPALFIDGVLINSLPVEVSINDMVLPDDVEGIEVYKGAATTPAEFMMGGQGCGVVAIWTRR